MRRQQASRGREAVDWQARPCAGRLAAQEQPTRTPWPGLRGDATRHRVASTHACPSTQAAADCPARRSSTLAQALSPAGRRARAGRQAGGWTGSCDLAGIPAQPPWPRWATLGLLAVVPAGDAGHLAHAAP